jgi:PilZ domain
MLHISKSPKGSPMQPDLASAELRQFRRNPVRAYAFVHVHGGFQPVTIVDYSRGGLQLKGTFGLFQGNQVDIEFMSGIRVAGRVAWCLGARAGIAFCEALPETHPAMSELARAARNVQPTPAELMLADIGWRATTEARWGSGA